LGRLGKPMLGLFARLLPKARIPIHSYLALYKVRVKHFGNARRFMQEDPLALEHITLGTLASLASTHLPNPDAIGSPTKEFKVYPKRGHGIMVNEPSEVAHDVVHWIKRFQN